jgi:ketosteroid isomerase-like protein
VLACDDRVIARRVAYRGRSADGGGEMEVRAGYVSVIEDGLFVSTDEYEYDDTAGMLARFAELGGAACAALGDRPPERLVAELLQRIPRRDVDAIVELYDEDCVIRDHRALGAGDIRGAAAIRTLYEAILTTSYDLRLDVDEVLAVDDRVIVLRQRFHGHGFDGAGYGEVPHGLVAVVRDGRLVEIDQYAADDEEAMLARFAELRRAAGSGGVELPGWAARQLESYNAHDLDGFAAVHAPHYRLVDHRAVGWGTISGRDEVVEHAAVTLRAIPDARMEIEDVLARDDRVLASRIVYSGHGPYGGGDFELTLGCVSVADGERVVSTDVYEPEDRAAMIARYAELGGGAARLAESASERVYAEFVRRYARRELEPLLELIAEDHVRIDHRPLGWEPVRGRAGDAELILSAWEGSTDIRIEVDEVLAASDRVLAVRIRWAGHSTDGGAFELPVGQVVLVQDGQIATIDQYASDDRQAMLDRFAELSGAGRPSPT